MRSRLEFGILGPLEVWRDGARVHVGGPRQRALLALLLCNANRVVSRQQLVDELLGNDASDSAERMLNVQISRLRKALSGEEEAPRVRAQPPGYLLRVEAGELDLHVSEQRLAEARSAREQGDARQAAALFREAESTWRGRPLADLELEPFARFEVQRLEELRLLAVEERIDTELALGHHASLCPELEALVQEHPLRERLRGQLMLSLYRTGRQAEALASYRAGRSLLVDELALEPSPQLRQLEQAILTQDESLLIEQLGFEPGREVRDLQARILRHDPGLDPPAHTVSSETGHANQAIAPARADPRAARSRPPTVAPVAAILAVLVAVIVGGIVTGQGRGAAIDRVLRAPGLGMFDTRSGDPLSAAALPASRRA